MCLARPVWTLRATSIDLRGAGSAAIRVVIKRIRKKRKKTVKDLGRRTTYIPSIIYLIPAGFIFDFLKINGTDYIDRLFANKLNENEGRLDYAQGAVS